MTLLGASPRASAGQTPVNMQQTVFRRPHPAQTPRSYSHFHPPTVGTVLFQRVCLETGAGFLATPRESPLGLLRSTLDDSLVGSLPPSFPSIEQGTRGHPGFAQALFGSAHRPLQHVVEGAALHKRLPMSLSRAF